MQKIRLGVVQRLSRCDDMASLKFFEKIESVLPRRPPIINVCKCETQNLKKNRVISF